MFTHLVRRPRRSVWATSVISTFVVLTAGCFEPSTQGSGKGVPPDPSNPAHHEVTETGATKPGLEAVDDAVRAWMRATCTGAVSISLGFGETPSLARGYGYKSGPPNVVCQLEHPDDPFFVENEEVTPNTPFRIGSNTKPILAAVLRDVLKKKLADLGRPATDEAVENLKVFDEDLPIVSSALRRAVRGQIALAPIVCQKPLQQPSGAPVVAGGAVDPRWLDITVGHLLSHRSGLPRDANSPYLHLERVRGITTKEQFDQQEELALAPEHARTALREKVSQGERFVPQASLEEYLIANTDMCLEYDPGSDPPATEEDDDGGYSNFGFGILQHIAEHVGHTSFVAPLGAHSVHGSSLLAEFLESKLGIEHGQESDFGIYFSQPVVDQRDKAEPEYRSWNGSSILGMTSDLKRPHCFWDTSRANCALFFQSNEKFNWAWDAKPVPVGYSNTGYMPGAGLLAAEMPLLQRFMARYWVSDAPGEISYGRERASNPSTQHHVHHGKLAGSFSTVAQFMGGDVTYSLVPRKDGELDLSTLGDATPTATCKLPSGLNLAMAANQTSDSRCNGDSCDWRYRGLREVVKEALCEVDWLKVSPQLGSN